jgi:hypothetical protein
MQHPVPEVYGRVKIFRLLAILYPGGGGGGDTASQQPKLGILKSSQDGRRNY